MEQLKYRAFLSYSHRDSKWADWLHKSLESYRPPKALVGTTTAHGVVPKRLAPVFRDREELASATDLGTVITAALRDSACQIVICSPRAAKSRWVNEEILAFKRLGREDRIFCVIVDGEPNASDDPGNEDNECFPSALRFQLGPDGNLGTTRTEPIAADARTGKDGKPRAKLKLIAGILGVGYDALQRREAQRRNRRLFAIACAAMVGMVITSGLATYALIQRATAQRQRVRAEAEAETARQTTSFLVSLFRISDPSEARGNKVTAREVLDKGAASIATDLAKQPAIQATLLDTLGSVYMGLGLYSQARPLLEHALTTRRHLGAGESTVLADSLNHLGELQMWQAEYDAAEKDYKEALGMPATQGADARSRAERAKALYGLGIVQGMQGRYADAEASLRAALALQRALYGSKHEDTARTLKELADVVDQGGDLKAAIPLMQEAVTIQRDLHGSEPHPAVYEGINDLALMLYENQQYEAAEKYFREALAMARRLYGDKHVEVAGDMVSLGDVLHNKGELEKAESLYRQALAMQRELLGEYHPDIAMALNNLAFVQYDRGHTELALQTLRESLRVYRHVFQGDHPDVARTLNRIGLWLTLAGNYAEADRDLHEALDMRRRLLGNTHPEVASSLMHVAILDVATRRYADAQACGKAAAEIYAASLSPNHWRTAVAESAEGAALTGLGRYGEAEKLLAHGYGILSQDSTVLSAYRNLASQYVKMLRERQGDADAAGQGGSAGLSTARAVSTAKK